MSPSATATAQPNRTTGAAGTACETSWYWTGLATCQSGASPLGGKWRARNDGGSEVGSSPDMTMLRDVLVNLLSQALWEFAVSPIVRASGRATRAGSEDVQ